MKKSTILIAIFAVLLGGVLFIVDKRVKTENFSVSESTDFYSIKADYPNDSWDKTGIMKQTVEYLINLKKEEWKEGGEIYNSEQEIARDFPDRPKMQYQMLISYSSTTSEKLGTRSYTFNVYEFTGGAHGNTAITTYNFNKKGQIKVEDLVDFSGGGYIKLAKLIRSKLVQSLGENANLRMINDGLDLTYLKPDDTIDKEKCDCEGFYFPSNVQYFTVKDEGMKFIFGQYQVGPYALGTPEVLLTWEELKAILLSKNILGVE
ncbi:MAG: DUF3298 domain-containing protein [Minisyncoccia bacterium]